jgi:hypothetical protein
MGRIAPGANAGRPRNGDEVGLARDLLSRLREAV